MLKAELTAVELNILLSQTAEVAHAQGFGWKVQLPRSKGDGHLDRSRSAVSSELSEKDSKLVFG